LIAQRLAILNTLHVIAAKFIAERLAILNPIAPELLAIHIAHLLALKSLRICVGAAMLLDRNRAAAMTAVEGREALPVKTAVTFEAAGLETATALSLEAAVALGTADLEAPAAVRLEAAAIVGVASATASNLNGCGGTITVSTAAAIATRLRAGRNG
jgi:hypothetical protein